MLLRSMMMLLVDHFDMTVTMGNVLTILAFAVAAIAFGLRMEGRVKLNESKVDLIQLWIKGHAECSRQQLEILNELRSAIAYMRGRNGFHERKDDQ